jgi:hypothetical protein
MTIQEHLSLVWKTDESDMVMTSPARRKNEDETQEECLVATLAPMTKGKPLVLL